VIRTYTIIPETVLTPALFTLNFDIKLPNTGDSPLYDISKFITNDDEEYEFIYELLEINGVQCIAINKYVMSVIRSLAVPAGTIIDEILKLVKKYYAPKDEFQYRAANAGLTSMGVYNYG
jgi:hypothetical protein